MGPKKAKKTPEAYIVASTWLDVDYDDFTGFYLLESWEDVASITACRPTPMMLGCNTLGIATFSVDEAVAEANRLEWARKLHSKTEFLTDDCKVITSAEVSSKLEVIKGRIAAARAEAARARSAGRKRPAGWGDEEEDEDDHSEKSLSLKSPAQDLKSLLEDEADDDGAAAAGGQTPFIVDPAEYAKMAKQFIKKLDEFEIRLSSTEKSLQNVEAFVYEPTAVALYNFPLAPATTTPSAHSKVVALLTALGFENEAKNVKGVDKISVQLIKIRFGDPAAARAVVERGERFKAAAWQGRSDGPDIVQSFQHFKSKMGTLAKGTSLKFGGFLTAERWSRIPTRGASAAAAPRDPDSLPGWARL